MTKTHRIQIAMLSLMLIFLFTPINASAALLKKGSRGGEVKSIQMALKDLGFFNYTKATGYYGTITHKAVKQFQRKNGLIVDGIVGKQTKNALLQLEKEGKITRKNDGAKDWFKDVQYIFKRGTNATITDVETGKTFDLKRTYGTNHADVEPLTKKDSAIIKDIWNGWSWERRAVVVKVGNYTLAGSMTAMPHAGVDSAPASTIVSNRSGGYGRGSNLDAVKGNGANGHMDIHFLNSRTHSTNIKQASHQNMVWKASDYILKNFN